MHGYLALWNAKDVGLHLLRFPLGVTSVYVHVTPHGTMYNYMISVLNQWLLLPNTQSVHMFLKATSVGSLPSE